MRIEPRETIADVPMLRVRDLMRWLRDYLMYVSPSMIAEYLRLDTAQAAALTTELLHRGMLVEAEGHPRQDETQYKLASNGCRLAVARATRPIKRPTAERLLGEFQARVGQINNNTYYLYRISRVVIFGSYLSDVPTLGDVDLIVHLEPKEQEKRRHKQLCVQRNLDFLHRGWNVGQDTLYVFYDELPRREVFVALRNRSSYLSLHSYRDEVVIEGQPSKVIYGAKEYVIPARLRESYGFEDGLAIDRIAVAEGV